MTNVLIIGGSVLGVIFISLLVQAYNDRKWYKQNCSPEMSGNEGTLRRVYYNAGVDNSK